MLEEIFQQCKDFEFYKTDFKFDILMVLGYYVTRNRENTDTIIGLINNEYKKPELTY